MLSQRIILGALGVLVFASGGAISMGSAQTGAANSEATAAGASFGATPTASQTALVAFFQAWRAFQMPRIVDGTMDYSKAGMERQHRELADWQRRLAAMDRTGWPIPQQVDWQLIRAEMNGMDFDYRVLRPWERDPAFYVVYYPSATDVPAREAPTVHGAIEMAEYARPLSASDAAKLTAYLRMVPKLYEQAQVNLTGNCRDLWVNGTPRIGAQAKALAALAQSEAQAHPDLAAAAQAASAASTKLSQWLTAQEPTKTGPSGVGKENYTWYMHHVQLVPYSYEEEELLHERELARGLATLRLQEHDDRNLPPLKKIDNEAEFTRLAEGAVAEYMKFLDEDQIVTVKPYMGPAMEARTPKFRAEPGLRSFFDEITYRDPMVMHTHDYHWFEKARMREEPNPDPIRATPPLYNIWMERAEGFATAFEEMMEHAGAFDKRPRAKELISILIADRAARGLGGLRQQGNEISIQDAAAFTAKWVPWGLMSTKGLIENEQTLYLRQPGYGTSYLTGKMQIDELIAEYARQREGKFELKDLIDRINTTGFLPISLIYWELTGDKSMLERAIGKEGK